MMTFPIRDLFLPNFVMQLPVGSAIGLVLLAASGFIWVKAENRWFQHLALLLSPAVNLCWLIIGSTYVYSDEVWCDASIQTSAYVVMTMGYIVVIPAIMVLCAIMVGVYAVACDPDYD